MKQGFIKATYIEHMGSDLRVVNAARASFDSESEWWTTSTGAPPYEGALRQPGPTIGPYRFLKQRDARLIRFLATGYRTGEWEELRNDVRGCLDDAELDAYLQAFKNKAQHWAPFAHPHIQLRVEMPIFLARQMVKHQIGGVWSEISRRYVSDNLEFWLPDEWHTRPADVKQGSGDAVQNQAFCSGTARRVTSQAEAAYQTLLAEGVAPEEARIVLPHNLMTTVVWTGSLLFWARVCNQRLDGHAQLAAQELAKKIATIVQPLFPVSWGELVHA